MLIKTDLYWKTVTVETKIRNICNLVERLCKYNHKDLKAPQERNNQLIKKLNWCWISRRNRYFTNRVTSLQKFRE